MITIDLINENSVNINSTYTASFKLCGSPDLSLYSGACQIKPNVNSPSPVLSPVVEIISKDVFKITINHDDYPSDITPSTYQYDVLFYNNDERFYAVGGKIQLIKRVTSI